MVDRNQAAKQKAQAQFAAAQQRKAFQAALAAGQTGAYDKEKTKIEAGHLVVWGMPDDIFYWHVKSCDPALDLPQAAMRITLEITIPLVVQPGIRMGNMLVVGSQKESPGALARDELGEGIGDKEPAKTGEPPADESQPRGAPEEQTDGADGTDKPSVTLD